MFVPLQVRRAKEYSIREERREGIWMHRDAIDWPCIH
jgi:hypothetical protein